MDTNDIPNLRHLSQLERLELYHFDQNISICATSDILKDTNASLKLLSPPPQLKTLVVAMSVWGINNLFVLLDPVERQFQQLWSQLDSILSSETVFATVPEIVLVFNITNADTGEDRTPEQVRSATRIVNLVKAAVPLTTRRSDRKTFCVRVSFSVSDSTTWTPRYMEGLIDVE